MNQDDRTRLDGFEKKLDTVTDNHIPHIYEVIGKIKGRLSVLIPLVIATLFFIGGLYYLLISRG